MPYQIITMPFDRAGKVFVPDELNRFCLNKNILSRKIEFFTHDELPYWSVLLEYETILENLPVVTPRT